jgi:hypothetical protein
MASRSTSRNFRLRTKVCPLCDTYLIVKHLSERLEREVLLLQRGHPLQELFTEDVDGGLLESGDGEQVDDLPGLHCAADDLADSQVDVSLARGAAAVGIVGEPLTDNRDDALKKGQVLNNCVRFGPRHSQGEQIGL